MTLTRQIIGLLTLTLIVAQGLNLFLLIGERQAVARTTHYEALVDRMVEEALRLPTPLPEQLPFVIRDGAGFAGTVFLAREPQARSVANAKPLSTYSAILITRFKAEGFTPTAAYAAYRSIESSTVLSPPPLRQEQRQEPGRRPPPGNFDRPPPRSADGPMRRPDNRPPDRPGDGPPDRQTNGPRDGPPRNAPPPLPSAIDHGPGFEEVLFSVALSPGVWLNAMAPHYNADALTSRAIQATALTLLGAIAAALLLTWRIVRPLNDLAAAADRFGRGAETGPVPEQGPKEIRAAAHAFNRMQAQLKRVISGQQTTLRALGHDLRTPLTTLRLRLEAVPESAAKEKLAASVDTLEATTEEILSWARDTTSEETVAAVDLTSLIDALVEDYGDQGKPVTFSAPGNACVIPCKRQGLRRAFTNLINNALQFGKTADLSIVEAGEWVQIHVDDDGPGIPEDQLTAVLEPFSRLDNSRSRHTGGMGLGLSLVRVIAENNGGTLELSNRPAAGLRATIALPRSAS